MNNQESPCAYSYANGKHFSREDIEMIGMFEGGMCLECYRQFFDMEEETLGSPTNGGTFPGHCPGDGC